MKKKKIIYIIGAVIIIGALTCGYFIEHYYNITKKTDIKTESIQNSKVNLVIDTENKDVLPKNFRTTKDEINSEKSGDTSLVGLSDLNISGSGALSEKGLAMIKEKIGNKTIMDIDLR